MLDNCQIRTMRFFSEQHNSNLAITLFTHQNFLVFLAIQCARQVAVTDRGMMNPIRHPFFDSNICDEESVVNT